MSAAFAPLWPLRATVPGCVHTNLLAQGLIADPYVDRNDQDAQWISESGWRYTCVFHADPMPAGERADVVCDGLDTFARVMLNGIEIGRSESMHVRHRFDARTALRAGANELVIDFEGPMPAVRRLLTEHGELPHEGHGSNPHIAFNAVRKMACSFGWDWGPVLPSVGVWRAVALERWRGARVADVRPLVERADDAAARVRVLVDLELDGPDASVEIDAELRGPDGAIAAREGAVVGASNARTVGEVTLTVPDPSLWWPAGHGGQPLYTLKVVARAAGAGGPVGAVRSAWAGRVGLRTVELDTSTGLRGPVAGIVGPQAAGQTTDGRAFTLRVNGRPIFCKGANWIPDDCFVSRITPARYRRRLKQARDANMNMLRVWGGGIYESHDFYDACDELGILVWQDFLCACAAYHEHEPYRGWFEAEARDNIARLARHASLALWCGNNECHEAVQHWGSGFERLREHPSIPWGKGLYHALFPRVVAELDPSRPYWPGSPYSSEPGESMRAEHTGDQHIWDVWNNGHSGVRYLAHAPRFASEFGFHGPPTWPTLARAIPKGQRRFDSPAMVHHNKHKGGQALANTRLADFFEPPSNFDDWLYLAQVVQARSLEYGCAWFRSLAPWCAGALFWQLNDCWPVASWSAIDGDGRPKPLWYATRRFFRPRLLAIGPATPVVDGAPPPPLAVHAHNDDSDDWRGTLTVHAIDGHGRSVATLARHTLDVPARHRQSVTLEGTTADPRSLVATLESPRGTERAFWFPVPDRLLKYPEPEMDFTLERDGPLHRLSITARSFVRDLCVFADRLDPDATVSDQLLTLLPGDRAEVLIRSSTALPLAELTAAPVMQCANRFGAL